MNRIARWDQSSWTPLGIGAPYQFARVEAIHPYAATPGEEPWLYVGGFFPSIGGVVTQGIARFRQGVWMDVGGGVGPPNAVEVLALREYDEDGPGGKPPVLFVGGSQASAGPAIGDGLSRWDGTSWSAVEPPLGSSATSFPYVAGLEVYDDDGVGPRREALYAVGGMTTAGGVSALRIARWDGQGWEALAGPGQTPGLTGYPVTSLAVFDEDGPGPKREALFVGGDFTKAGGLPARSIARWDGQAWSALPGVGVGGGVEALAVFDDDGPGPNKPALFVGGYFNHAGGFPTEEIAKWDGQQWVIIPKIIGFTSEDGFVLAMTVFDEDGAGPNPGGLYAGGIFLYAGTVFSPGLARWGCPLPVACYANCTNDLSRVNGQHVLTVADFGCFQTRYVMRDPYADCNQDAQFTVADFGCFQTKFAAGCP